MPGSRSNKSKVKILTALTAGAVAAGAWLSNANTAFDFWGKLRDSSANLVIRIIQGNFQFPDFDVFAIRAANSTGKLESIAEPTIECRDGLGGATIWHSIPDMQYSLPSFPAVKQFPLDIPAGSQVELTIFVPKTTAPSSLLKCDELRFVWLDSQQKRQFGEGFKLPAGAVVFNSSGPT